MQNPMVVHINIDLRELRSQAERAGISTEQFQHGVNAHLRQWMRMVGQAISHERAQEAVDELMEGPLVRIGAGAQSGVAKLKTAILEFNTESVFNEADVRDVAAPGWHKVVVKLNVQFDETLQKLSLLQPSLKDPDGPRSSARDLYCEALSLSAYVPDREAAQTLAEQTYEEVMSRLGEKISMAR
jgi:hypothetical protein